MNDTALNTNLRRLKRVQTERGLAFTLETEADRKRNLMLCAYCAWSQETPDYQACSIYKELRGFESNGLVPVVRTCSRYQPVITFRPRLVGLDGVFNTFRLGVSWFNRLSPGVIVGLVNAETNEVFGKAKVLQVLHGSFDEMVEKHSHMNHLLLGMEPEEAASKMREIIARSYGKLVAANAQTITVVYLRNLKFNWPITYADDHQGGVPQEG